MRVLFKHFADLAGLRGEAIGRIERGAQDYLSIPVDPKLPVAQRLKVFVVKQTRLLEAIAPFRRTAMRVEAEDPAVAVSLRRALDGVSRELERVLAPEIKALRRSRRRSLVMGLHCICSWPSWEMLRTHYRLTSDQARKVVTQAALAVIRDAAVHGSEPAPNQ